MPVKPYPWLTQPPVRYARPRFVAVLGASNYSYAEAMWTQELGPWIGAHCRALEFLGGVPAILVPDNLKAGVHRASR